MSANDQRGSDEVTLDGVASSTTTSLALNHNAELIVHGIHFGGDPFQAYSSISTGRRPWQDRGTARSVVSLPARSKDLVHGLGARGPGWPSTDRRSDGPAVALYALQLGEGHLELVGQILVRLAVLRRRGGEVIDLAQKGPAIEFPFCQKIHEAFDLRVIVLSHCDSLCS